MATFSGRSTKATAIYNQTTNLNEGAISYCRLVNDGTNIHWPLVEWDLSSLEGMTADTDGTFTGYIEGTDRAGNFTTANIYKVLRAWNEGTKSDATADTGEATWSHAKYNEDAWGTAGCNNTTSDRSGTPEDEITNPYSAVNIVGTITQATIQDWLDDSANNKGITMQLVGGSGSRYWYFWSDDYTGTSQDPLLEFDYSEASSGIVSPFPSFKRV